MTTMLSGAGVNCFGDGVGAIPRTRRRGERLGVIDMMRRGGVAERVIGTACAAQDCGSREASTSLSRSSRVRMGEWKFCK